MNTQMSRSALLLFLTASVCSAEWDNGFKYGLRKLGDKAQNLAHARRSLLWGEMASDVDFCSILEKAVDMSQDFGVAGDCTCEGTVGDGFTLGCDFEDVCYELVCGTLGVDFSFDLDGSVSVGVCVDLADDEYAKTCFTYEGWNEPTCTATYDDKDCICSIDEDYCLSLNCSAHLDGAFTDDCQEVKMGDDVADASMLLPKFKIFSASSDPGDAFGDALDGIGDVLDDLGDVGDSIGDLFPAFGDEDKNETGDQEGNSVEWGNIDWGNIDWADFDLGTVDWEKVLNLDNFDACPLVERAVGIGENFGIAGDCACKGDFASGVAVDCIFENECTADDGGICGTVSISYSFGDLNSATARPCVDVTSDGETRKVCFSYDISMRDKETQNCTASYADNDCVCTIDEHFCISVDCSSSLPDAKTDTCQMLRWEEEWDAETFILRFPVFKEGYQGAKFADVEWRNIDWKNLDWSKFSFQNIDWGNADVKSLDLTSIFEDTNLEDFTVCSVLENIVGMNDEFGEAGECVCDGNILDGMSVECNFENACSDDEQDEICGSVDLKLSYDNMATVSSNVCVNYSEDEHPETCFSYNIPLGDRSEQECSATYGGENCLCEIDQDTLCINVNCSMYETSAVTNTCQSLSVEYSDASAFVPKFAVPEFFVTNGTGSGNGGDGKINNSDDVMIVEDDPNGALGGTGSSSASAVRVSFVTTLTIAIFYIFA
jgi:hypothetical protein